VGLSVARELLRRYPSERVVLLEKEPTVGRHASGRNSGVLHSGVYYPPGSLKARICAQGRAEWVDFCSEHGVPLMNSGKLLVPMREEDAGQLDLLEARGPQNGVEVERLDEQALRAMEPEVRSATGEALYVPATAVVSAPASMEALAKVVHREGADVRFGSALRSVDPGSRSLSWGNEPIHYGHVVNCAGTHADTVAHRFGVGERYTLLPFRGIYWKVDPAAGFSIRRLVYPVPDLRVPFLGVHTTTTVDGDLYLGPTAIPALGRENYGGLAGASPWQAARIFGLLVRQFAGNRDGFRRLARQEALRYFKGPFTSAAKALLPRLQPSHLLPTRKTGIRAQMLDRKEGRMVMDFLVERGHHSTHVLNAISPAFTCAFPLARLLVDEFIENSPGKPKDVQDHDT